MRFRTIFAAAALALASTMGVASAQEADTLRVCAGSPDGNYHFAASEVANRVKGSFKNVVVLTTGGSLDNLRKLSSGECDMGIVQSDVYDLYRMENPASLTSLDAFKTLYSEYVHMICPVAADFTRVTHLGKANGGLIVGPDGGGQAETWRALRKADEKLYGKVERIADSVGTAAASKVKDSKNICMLWVSGLNSPSMQAVNIMSINTPKKKAALMLLNVDDRDFKSITGSDGKPLYRFETIYRVDPNPSKNKPGMYNNLMQSSSVTVPVVDAILVTSRAYKQSLGSKEGRLVIAIEDASPTIWKRVAQPE